MRRILNLLLVLILWPLQAAAQQEQQDYDVRFRGITVAHVTLALRDTGRDYAVAAQVRAAPLAGLFATVRFDMSAEGRFAGAGPRPLRFREDNDTGRRQNSVEMRWQGGLPVVLSQAPAPGPEAVAPAAATGTIDPLSALLRLARDQDGDTLCNHVSQIYDGARRSQLSLGAADISGDRASCAGEYRRLDGYRPDELAERVRFPFTLHYAQDGGVWRLTEVEATSFYGRVRIQRRD